MIIRLKNLKARTLIGVHPHERRHKQTVTVNVELDFDGTRAAETDQIEDTLDYEAIRRRVVGELERADYQLLEKLAARLLAVVMEDPQVLRATVEVDKPQALAKVESVSVSCSARRDAPPE